VAEGTQHVLVDLVLEMRLGRAGAGGLVDDAHLLAVDREGDLLGCGAGCERNSQVGCGCGCAVQPGPAHVDGVGDRLPENLLVLGKVGVDPGGVLAEVVNGLRHPGVDDVDREAGSGDVEGHIVLGDAHVGRVVPRGLCPHGQQQCLAEDGNLNGDFLLEDRDRVAEPILACAGDLDDLRARRVVTVHLDRFDVELFNDLGDDGLR
jgi:hypothetical protein